MPPAKENIATEKQDILGVSLPLPGHECSCLLRFPFSTILMLPRCLCPPELRHLCLRKLYLVIETVTRLAVSMRVVVGVLDSMPTKLVL